MSYSKIIVLVIVTLSISLLLVRCTAVRSWFDNVYLVHQFNTPVDEAKTPKGFVVTVKELRGITPFTKFGWNIYADENNYYFSSGVQRLFAKTGDNSCLARKNGIKIAGTDRKDYELVMDYFIKKNIDRIKPIELRELLENN